MMDKSDYGENIMAHLRDETTYERLRKNPTAVEPTAGVLSKEDYYKVYTSSEIPLSFMASQRYIKMKRHSSQL